MLCCRNNNFRKRNNKTYNILMTVVFACFVKRYIQDEVDLFYKRQLHNAGHITD